MKNELKTLYRKNPKLALQVAKALRLKIRVKAQDEDETGPDTAKLKNALKLMDKALDSIQDALVMFDDAVGDYQYNPQITELSSEAQSRLLHFVRLVKKEFRI